MMLIIFPIFLLSLDFFNADFLLDSTMGFIFIKPPGESCSTFSTFSLPKNKYLVRMCLDLSLNGSFDTDPHVP